MPIKCLECGKEFKSQLTSHLPVHDMNKQSYLEKHPGASTIDSSLVDKFAGRKAWNKGKVSKSDSRILSGKDHGMSGKSHTEESKKKNSETHLKLYREDSGYKKRVSEGTKKAMAKPEVRKKFMNHVQNRDYAKECNPFYGKTHSEETKRRIYTKERAQKISEKRIAWWSGRKGKTVEELYGEKTGRHIRLVKSKQTRGDKNPAYGKTYKLSGHGKLGYYKGVFFRSTYEYWYMKFLEKKYKDEITNKKKFMYEPFRIDYIYRGVNRTYAPDFLLVEERVLVEIKPKFKIGDDIVLVKKQAAEEYCKERGLTYEILTEKDFPILTYAQAYADPDVVWIRR